MTTDKPVGKRMRFVYPNFGTSAGLTDYRAHSGQVVTVVRQLSNGRRQSMYEVRADDGWLGQAYEDELTEEEGAPDQAPFPGNQVQFVSARYLTEFSFIRIGYAPKPVEWHAVSDCLPAIEDDSIAGFLRSRDVLLCQGDRMMVGYLQGYDDDEFPPEWKLSGRDSYTGENVTHWRTLPMPPNP